MTANEDFLINCSNLDFTCDSLTLNSNIGDISIGNDDTDTDINIGIDGNKSIIIGTKSNSDGSYTNQINLNASNINLTVEDSLVFDTSKLRIFSDDIDSSSNSILYINTSNVISTSASDKRLKCNIEKICNGLEIVNKFNPVSYTWKNGIPKGAQNVNAYGFIAQDIRDILPNAVLGKESENEYLNFDDRSILSYNTKAIQELFEDNQNMKLEIEKLKDENKIFKKKLNEIIKKLEKNDI
jgi:hypothetical protein